MVVAAKSHYHITPQGTKTHFMSYGSKTGRLLILLHGLGGSSATFTPLLPHLPLHNYNVLAVDLEGFGSTPLTDRNAPLSIGKYVADLESLVAHMESSDGCEAPKQSNATSISIIGHSLGSVVALQYAARHPNKVKGLGLLGVGRSASHIAAARDRMLNMAATARNEGMKAVSEVATQTNVPPGAEGSYARDEVRKAVLSGDPEAYARTCEAMVSSDHKDPDYSAVTCPTVLIFGEHDFISPPSRSEELAPLLGSKSVVLRSVHSGHQPILSDLQGTMQAIDELLAMVDG